MSISTNHLVEVFHDFDVSRNRHWRLICPLENKDVVDKKPSSAALDIVVQIISILTNLENPRNSQETYVLNKSLQDWNKVA